MKADVCIGDRVKLIGVPDWLIHDLPNDEKAEIVACVGSIAVVSDIDSHGYFWLGFGCTTEDTDGANFTGHSFCVSREYLQKESTTKGVEQGPSSIGFFGDGTLLSSQDLCLHKTISFQSFRRHFRSLYS